MESALVFGAAGFIGRWVAQELTRAGVTVHAAVRDVAGSRTTLDRWNVRAQLHQTNLDNEGSGAALIEAIKPSHVFNLAGYGVDRQERDPVLATRLNVDLVAELAEACAASPHDNPIVLVHAGSAAEYGETTATLDEHLEGAPTSLYGRTKLQGTERALAIARERRSCVVVARLFTVFGDGEHEGRLLPSLTRAAQTQQPVRLSTGEQERDFAWVGDAARALVQLGTLAPAGGAIINVASGRAHSVADFVRMAAAALSLPPELLHFGAIPAQPGDAGGLVVAVDRMRETLGYALPTDLADRARAAVDDARARTKQHDAS